MTTKTKNEIKPKFSITGVFIPDPGSEGFTGFFAEIPEAISEGDSFEEAERNLLRQ